ncbi:MAG: prepilin-type N-terminal cleavage/methylation domain-containing protein, partial [Kiritimatiellaceae bacterium]|nr:prepilin-type N-terminal cleavage/methylation domain-containing protein [Kiritimatiellaceae bacterium]
QNKAGFTLVELMVVAIIVAILAAVAIPLMSGNKKRAMQSEGDASIGTMVTALRVYRAEYGGYPPEGGKAAATGTADDLPSIGSTDLDGQFFDTSDFTYSSSASNYTVTCEGKATSGRGDNEGDTEGMTTKLDSAGVWTRTGY